MGTKRTESRRHQSPVDRFDALDTEVSSSTSVGELESAYKSFQELNPTAQRDILVVAGPARTVELALRGYEMPVFEARIASSVFLANVIQIVDQRETPQALREQIWLILAQQRTVLLERLEADIDALETSRLPKPTQMEWRAALDLAYSLIRTKSEQAITRLFRAPLAQSELPLGASLA